MIITAKTLYSTVNLKVEIYTLLSEWTLASIGCTWGKIQILMDYVNGFIFKWKCAETVKLNWEFISLANDLVFISVAWSRLWRNQLWTGNRMDWIFFTNMIQSRNAFICSSNMNLKPTKRHILPLYHHTHTRISTITSKLSKIKRKSRSTK